MFELLSINLYELLKQNQFRGLPLSLIRHFIKQILEVRAWVMVGVIVRVFLPLGYHCNPTITVERTFNLGMLCHDAIVVLVLGLCAQYTTPIDHANPTITVERALKLAMLGQDAIIVLVLGLCAQYNAPICRKLTALPYRRRVISPRLPNIVLIVSATSLSKRGVRCVCTALT